MGIESYCLFSNYIQSSMYTLEPYMALSWYIFQTILLVKSIKFEPASDCRIQEQQQKQFDLILAIGKTSKLWEGKLETSEVQNKLEASKSDEDEINKKEVHQI